MSCKCAKCGGDMTAVKISGWWQMECHNDDCKGIDYERLPLWCSGVDPTPEDAELRYIVVVAYLEDENATD